jgi:heme O synthase-like polyprenyltransferase
MKNLIKAILITIAAFVVVCGVFYLAAHFINWFIGIASIVLFAFITLAIKLELDEKDDEVRDYEE